MLSRVLAPAAVAASLIAGTIGASLPSETQRSASESVASNETVRDASQPAEGGSRAVDAYYDSGPAGSEDADAAGEAGEPVIAAADAAATSVTDFGAPPSGEVPVLLNDRHVYSKPDRLQRGRLLAALVRDGSILVPLRALFEQLGATVSYDSASMTATAHKAGTEIKLVVGKHVAVIDGVARPLDVPPMKVGSAILVPVRVIAEVFGAYVQWLPDKRAVSIRYLSPTAVAPASAETPVPLAVATALPTPRPRRTVGPGPALPKAPPSNETFIAVDPLIAPRVANEFAPNVTGSSGTSFALRGADEFDFFGAKFEVDARYTKNRYPHPDGNVTLIGLPRTHFVPATVINDYALALNFGVQLSPEKFYLSGSYLTMDGNVGYPRLNGLGLGITKLPVLDRKIAVEGDVRYYPNVDGTCTTPCPAGPFTLSYKVYRYDAGLTALLGHNVFVEGGFQGDKGIAKSFAPASFTHSGPFGGLGVRF